MGILAWIVLGGLAGWLASKIARTEKSQGLLGNIITGVVGAFIGGLLVNLIGGEGITGFNLWSLLVATGGAIILLAILGGVQKSRINASTSRASKFDWSQPTTYLFRLRLFGSSSRLRSRRF